MASKALGIMQPYFFPYIGYFQTINAVDKYILYSNVNYIRAGWIHRNRILEVNNGPVYIIANVVHRSSFKKIYEMKLDCSNKWRKKILCLIYMNYKRSPFFEEIYPIVEQIINYDTQYLHTLNEIGIRTLCKYLNIDTQIVCDNEKYSDLEEKLLKLDSNDFSDFPYLEGRKPTKKVLRVIDICRRVGAKTFKNAIGGQALYNKCEFASYNIELKFISAGNFSYPQKASKFYPNLSIIDVLMNCGRDKTQMLLNQYTLI